MSNRDEGLRWFDQAQADLKTAGDCLRDGNYYASAFFSQQSAEKALKGLLYAKGFRALITHSVLELLEECAKDHRGFVSYLEQGRELDRHYLALGIPISTLRVLPTGITARR